MFRDHQHSTFKVDVLLLDVLLTGFPPDEQNYFRLSKPLESEFSLFEFEDIRHDR